MLTIVAGAATSAGRLRSVNEDAFFLGTGLFAVADGMGGHRAGDRASALAIQHLAGLAGARVRTEEIVDAIVSANEAIALEADQNQERRGMGTTLVGLSLVELAGSPHWLVFNVGDSRLYNLADGLLQQVTVDHSEVQELVDAGQITAFDATTHPHRNVITRSIGTRPQPTVDTWLLPHEPSASFLLCSDGLTTELSDDRILALLTSSETPQVAADRLVEAAEVAGGRDNITVVVVRCESADGTSNRHALETTQPRGSEGNS